MSDPFDELGVRLSALRDNALELFEAAAVAYGDHSGDYDPPKVWHCLPPQARDRADYLRGELRPLMVIIEAALRGSPLLGKSDFLEIGRQTKRMVSALRFNFFRQWDTQVYHDEGDIIGVDPPGQAEEELDSVNFARAVFVDSYRVVRELMDYRTPRRLVNVHFEDPGAEAVLSYRPNTAFIIMHIDRSKPELDDVKSTFQEVFSRFGVAAVRADEIEDAGVITDRIIQEIRGSEFLFADLTGERPSVYYEIGFAHAIGKPVHLFRKEGTKLHFDLAAYRCPEYKNLTDLRAQLTKRLEELTNRLGRSAAAESATTAR